ncbi:MAG TPA: amino acid adenylation domain-containing protein [Ktedonobacteraceae bacterium]
MTEHTIVSGGEEQYVSIAISHGPPLVPNPHLPSTLPEVLQQAASKPQGIVYIQEDGTALYQSYARLLQEASELLAGLQQLGLKPRDMAIFQFEQSEQFFLAFWSCLLGGIIPILLPVIHPTRQSAHAWQKLQQAYLIADEPYIFTSSALCQAWMENRTAEIPEKKFIAFEQLQDQSGVWNWHSGRAEDLAILALTSGSTGNAKLVMLNHRNILSQIRGITQVKHLSEADVSLNWMPLEHMGSLGTHIRDVERGMRQLQIANATILRDPLYWLDLIDRYRVTLTRAPNFAYRLVSEQEQHMIPQRWDLSSLRFIINGGEAIVPRVARRFLELLAAYGLAPGAMHPCWGMTETSSGVSCSETYTVTDSSNNSGFINLGPPLPGVSMRIVDEHGRVVQEGVTGYLQVAGATLSAGYYKNERANQEAFTADGWFNTGDLGFLAGGCLTITGRASDIIILNGVNYYSHEIEAAVEELHDVEKSYVAACAIHDVESAAPDKLALFFCPVSTCDEGRLTALLREIQHQVVEVVGIAPHYLIPLGREAIPKTSLGKIQRRQLAQQLVQGKFAEVIQRISHAFHISALEQIEPRNMLEEKLVALWQELFNLEQVGITDDFFALGGDSLLAIRVLAGLQTVAEIELSAYDLFSAPTIAGLAAIIAARQSMTPEQGQTRMPAIERSLREAAIPLSFAQERLWFQQQLKPESAFYHIPSALRLTGTLRLPELEQALEVMIHRHESLRTRIEQRGDDSDQFGQFVAPPQLFTLSLLHLEDCSAHEQQHKVQQIIAEEIKRPFQLKQEPLARFLLLRLQPEVHTLLVTMHHIISDGWSMDIFWSELARVYNACLGKQPLALPELPLQYVDFTLWQRRVVREGYLRDQLAYWRDQLAGSPAVLKLPTDFPRPATLTFRGGCQSIDLPPMLTEKVKALSRQEHTTLFMTLLAAFQVLLYRLTGQEDIIVGTPGANRKSSELHTVIGSFVNPLALRATLHGDSSFRTLLNEVRRMVLGAYDHQDIPFEVVVDALQPQRVANRLPIFQVMFAYQDQRAQQPGFDGLTVDFLAVDTQTAKADLTLVISETEHGLQAALEYSADLFAAATITRMLYYFQVLLQGVVDEPDQPLAQMPLLPAEELQQILVNWNRTATPYPEARGLHRLFEEQAARAPDALAVVSGEQQFSYQELNQRANQLAHYLQRQGVGPEVCVGVSMERSVEMIISFLGILKAGGAYVPLDPTYPPARLEFMLRETQAPLLLTQQRLLAAMPAPDTQVLCLDSHWPLIARESQENLTQEVSADSLAYIIYTSGSTGIPKGVSVPQRAILRLVCCTNYVQLEHGESIAQASTSSFDACTFEVWGALLNGASLIIIAQDVVLSPKLFAEQIARQGIRTLFLTTALFNLFAREEPGAFKHMKQVLFGGEAVDPRLVAVILREGAPQRLLHVYGPTENTTFTLWHQVHQVSKDASTIPMGQPIANDQVYILDQHMQPVPIGVPGELYISGPGLARGYLHHPDETAARFIPNPFAQETGARLYKTGDIVRYLPQGAIEFIGRRDYQVKLRGFRIELGEIESALAAHPAVREVCVLLKEERPGEKHLVACIVPRQDAPAPADLREYLRTRLPGYMLPSFYVSLTALPLSPNGKIDRRTLAALSAAPVADERMITPRSTLEGVVCALWSEVLGCERIGIYDNFFDLGGHSLTATRLVARLSKVFQVELPLRRLFETPTVADICAALVEYEVTPGRTARIAALRKRVDALSEDDIQALLHAKKSGRKS